MTREVAKAINALSNKMNVIQQSINQFFGKKCDDNNDAIINAEQTITDMDLAMIEAEQQHFGESAKVIQRTFCSESSHT